MSKDLESKSKKELVAIIEQLHSKLIELQGVEAKQDASESNLLGFGFSVVRDEEGGYYLVELGFDFHSKAAKILENVDLATKDYAIAAHRAKITLFDKVLNQDNVDHLRKDK
jgi:predicted transcriptional regulator YdeE